MENIIKTKNKRLSVCFYVSILGWGGGGGVRWSPKYDSDWKSETTSRIGYYRGNNLACDMLCEHITLKVFSCGWICSWDVDKEASDLL